MEINIGNSECDKSVDNYYGRNFGSHTAPAERLSTVSSPFMVTLVVTFENMHMSALALVIYHYIAASSIITKNCQ